MNVASKIRQAYMEYTPLATIRKDFGVAEKGLHETLLPVITKRAKISLDNIDMTSFKEDAHIIKSLVTKLSIIRNELFRRVGMELYELTIAETVDNYIKKIKASVNDSSEWFSNDENNEVTIIEETGSYVTAEWIFIVEKADSADMVAHAKTLVEKLNIHKSSNVVSPFVDIEAHKERCLKLNVDYKQYDEVFIKSKYELIFGGLE